MSCSPLRRAAIGCALLLAGTGVAVAAPSIALQSGAPVTLSIPANSFTSSYYVDVTAADQTLRIDLDSTTAGVDVDFFLRYGSPFPDGFSSGRPPSFGYIDELSHYRSISPINDEFVIVGKSGGQPLRAGRWYVFAFNFNTSQSTSIAAQSTLMATLSASTPAAAAFTVNFNSAGSATQPCSNSEWFDTTPVSPIGGNPGTTLGEQRRNAMLRAAENLSAQMRSPVAISIDACWANLGTGNSITLASAGPRSVLSNLPSMERKHTWYAGPPAARLAGTSFCRVAANDCNLAEIRATFNNQVDTPAALGDVGFHYGYAAAISGSNVDFISVGTHEITHGLGFLSLVSLSNEDGDIAGAEFQGMDDAFSANLAWLDNGVLRPFNLLTNAERMLGAVSGTNLKWTGASATSSTFNPRAALAFPDNLVQMYAPNPISTGSSVSHINQQGYNGELMRPQAVGTIRELMLSRNLLDGVGWSNATAAAPIDPIPLGGLFYDPRHDGHGIEFAPAVPGSDIFVLTFYTYDATGNPEWFQSLGRLIDGKFLPEPDANGNSLHRYTYDPSRPSGQRQRIDPNFSGRMRLDFVQAANAPACASTQNFTGYLAVMRFALGDNQTQEWCMQELVPRTLRPLNDLTGLWYAGEQDTGWGFTFGSIPGSGAGGLFSLLYYYDAQGKPRWALSSLDNLQAGSTGPLINRSGYCRTCAKPADFPSGRDTHIGSVTFNMQTATSASNRVTYSASWTGAEGGTFARTGSPLVILTVPAAVQQPR
jgi:hypothetical protein